MKRSVTSTGCTDPVQSNHIHMHGGNRDIRVPIVSMTHVLVTPCRDPDLIGDLIDSVVSQTALPREWVIVLHNTCEKKYIEISNYVLQHGWISVIKVDDDSKRRRGAQIARIVNLAISNITQDWTYLSKIDADMVLEFDYFERIFSKFIENEKLGIASGACYLIEGEKRYEERVADQHTRGGLKTYRRQCFDEIGGIREVDGWDGVDNIAANMAGWETSNYADIPVFHRRRTGSHNGSIHGCFEAGGFAYALRYFFPYLLARSIHRMFARPYFIGGVSMFFGYYSAVLYRKPSSLSIQEKKFLRKKQRTKLLSISRLIKENK